MSPEAADFDDVRMSPLACAFFLLAVRSGLTVDAVVQTRTAMELAAVARRHLDPWTGHAPEARKEVCDRVGEASSLAERVLGDERTAWWYEPGPSPQLFLASSNDGRLSVQPPEVPPSAWSRYAQRPISWTVTTSPLDSYSGLHALLAAQVGDWEPAYPIVPRLVDVSPQARILQVDTAGDWHDVCWRYPAEVADESQPEGLASRLAPAWAAVAEDWDGVRLSFAGLLAASYVPYGPTGRRTVLWTWDSEQTLWLRDVLTERTELPALTGPPELRHDIGPFELAAARTGSAASGYLRPEGAHRRPRRRWFRR